MSSDKIDFTMNAEHWDREVADGVDYTRPWVELERGRLEKYANGSNDCPGSPYSCVYPSDVLKDVAGKKVLCLASGGGQQSAVFGLLGADATVLELCEGQLKGDRIAAEAHGYDVECVLGDMRDLSMFADGQFDIVYQAISIVFVPDVREVYREVFRVLRPNGLYRVAHVNPATVPVCFDGPDNGWDGTGYRICEPYCGGPIRMKKDGSESMSEGEPTGEYRHLLSDVFNGLVECGFEFRGLWEAPSGDTNATPGTDDHMSAFIQQYFSILARKPT